MAKPLLGMLQSWDHHHSLMWKASQKKAKPHQQNQVLMAPAQSKVPIRQKGQLAPLRAPAFLCQQLQRPNSPCLASKLFTLGAVWNLASCCFFSGGALSFNNDATVILCLQFVYIHKDIIYRYNIYIIYARSLTLCIFSIYSIYIQR